MKTKYGNISNELFSDYRNSLINRIWSLIPLKEEHCETLEQNISRLNRELNGMIRVIDVHKEHVLTVIHLLENLNSPEMQNDFKAYKSDVFRCCEIIKKLNVSEGGAEDV